MKATARFITNSHPAACLACAIILLIAGCGDGGSTSKTTNGSTITGKAARLQKDDRGQVVSAEFISTKVAPAQVKKLKDHPDLRDVTFYECAEFSDGAFEELAKLDQVAELHFVRSSVDAAALEQLSRMKSVRHLALSNVELTASGLAGLKDWKQLKEVTLKGTVKPEVLKGLAAADQIEVLDLEMGEFDASPLAEFKFPNLRILRMTNIELSDADLATLPEWKSLTVFDFKAIQLTDAGVAQLTKYPALESLDLSESAVTDAGLSKLLPLKSIEFLSLNSCKKVSNEGLKALAQLPALERLLLDASGVTGTGLMHLVPAPRLRYIAIGPKQASPKQIAAFTAAAKDCKVDRINPLTGPKVPDRE